MIKLKIGNNYLITTRKDNNFETYVSYMISMFQGDNKIAVGYFLDGVGNPNPQSEDLVKAINIEKPRELYILFLNPNYKSKVTRNLSVGNFISAIKEANPGIIIHTIVINNQTKRRQYKIGNHLYNALRADSKSILKHVDQLDEYKRMAMRYKAIPAEIKVINDNLKQLSKEKQVNTKTITLKDLEYLNMIDSIEPTMDKLYVTIKPLPINPSEKLGLCISLEDFKQNPYLAKAAEFIYKGCHFRMVGTKISINTQFRPEFIETLDHSWDRMFRMNNWSSIGYPHFGLGHLCGGEFNDVMVHTPEHGLEYYFLCLKQYLTTANMRDFAGKKVWWYPIYNDNGELVYSAPLDALRDLYVGRNPEIKDLSWWELKKWFEDRGIDYCEIPHKYISEVINTGYSGKEDNFLKYCQEFKKDLYNELMKGAE